MSLVKTIHITRLGGFTQSNPEILASFPLDAAATLSKDNIIEYSLPEGVKPNTFSLIKIDKNYFLSYIFSISSENQNVREDLASISIVIDQSKIEIEDFKILFEHIVEIIIKQTDLKITTEYLIQSIENVYEGINNMQKVKIGKLIIDIPKIIKNGKLNPVKNIQIKGRIF